jgi:DNA-binding NarL/FixJ family response regulator
MAFTMVVESAAALAASHAELRVAAWVPRDGFTLPESTWSHAETRVVCTGTARDAGQSRAAVLAACRAAGVVVDVSVLPADLRDALVDDLYRAAPDPAPLPKPVTRLPLTLDQQDLLRQLARGLSVPAAARELYLSQRTAERRLGDARRALGVGTTIEAVQALVAAEGSADW